MITTSSTRYSPGIRQETAHRLYRKANRIAFTSMIRGALNGAIGGAIFGAFASAFFGGAVSSMSGVFGIAVVTTTIGVVIMGFIGYADGQDRVLTIRHQALQAESNAPAESLDHQG